jgi:hypothetical protein
MVRLAGVLALVAVLATACESRDEASAPEMTVSTQADLSVQAIRIGCTPCAYAAMYVRDQLLTADTLLGDELPMPPVVRNAIADAFPDAVFVSHEEASSLFGGDGVIEGGVLVDVGPVDQLAAAVVGVSIGALAARDGGRFVIVQFMWDGESWEPATSEETGITVTSAVS